MSERRFSPDGMWVEADDGRLRIGLEPRIVTGTIKRISLPEIGSLIRMAEPLGEIESDKATFELYSPCDGTVDDVNRELVAAPRDIRDDDWLLRAIGDMPILMDAATFARRGAR